MCVCAQVWEKFLSTFSAVQGIGLRHFNLLGGRSSGDAVPDDPVGDMESDKFKRALVWFSWVQ